MPSDLAIATPTTDSHLKLVFQWQSDRWAHQWVLVAGEGETTILSSLEGDAETVWPPSPTLQDASQHGLNSGDAILAVGMAGTSHWSASFSIENGQSILADVACLVKKSAPGSMLLRSSYEIGSRVEVIQMSGSEIELSTGRWRVKIELASDEEECPTNHSLLDNRLIFVPQQLSQQAGKATRWKYRVGIV